MGRVGGKRAVAAAVGTVLLGAAGALASGASCSYGNYDGSFDSAALEVGTPIGPDGAGAQVARTVAPAENATVATSDGVFEVTIVAGTFSAPTTVTITQLADRTIDRGLVVPTYAVAAGSEDPKHPVQVAFRGNSAGQPLVPSLQQSDGSFKPLPVFGAGNQKTEGGPNGGVQRTPFWGLSNKLGTFTLADVTGTPKGTFTDSLPSSCTSCCASSNGGPGSANATSYEGSCLCTSFTDPSPECFIKNCDDLTRATARCAAFDDLNPNQTSCTPLGCGRAGCPGQPGCPQYCNGGGGPGCTAVQGCCVDNTNLQTPSQCLNNGGGPGGTTCTQGFVARCLRDSDCKAGRCCIVGKETLCADTCPPDQRLCSNAAECTDAGVNAGDAGCPQKNKFCPFDTCGSPPSACQ